MKTDLKIIKGTPQFVRVTLEGLTYDQLLFARENDPDLFVLVDENDNQVFKVELGRPAAWSRYGVHIPIDFDNLDDDVTFNVSSPFNEDITPLKALDLVENLDIVLEGLADFHAKVREAEEVIEYV